MTFLGRITAHEVALANAMFVGDAVVDAWTAGQALKSIGRHFDHAGRQLSEVTSVDLRYGLLPECRPVVNPL